MSVERVKRAARENHGGQQRLTPAMRAGITNALWTMERLYIEVMASGRIPPVTRWGFVMRHDEFNRDDPYHVVALIFAIVQCDKCGEFVCDDPDTVADGDMRWVNLGNTARAAGWRVECTSDPNQWIVRCPKCPI